MGFNPVEAKVLKSKIDNATAGLSRVPTIPTVERNPVSQLGAVVLTLDDQTDRADEGTGFLADDREGRAGAIDPGWGVETDPLGSSAMRIRMRNVERGVGDFAHTGQSLDVERIISDEWAQR
jgi:hypothetical protein